jgi:hypothetical protein
MLGNSQIASKNGGYLTVITYVDGIGGTKVPVTQSIAPTTTIQTAAGTSQTPWGYKYVLESGKELWIQIAGNKAYDSNPFANSTGVESNGVVFSDGKLAPGVEALDSVPAFDFDSIVGSGPKGYIELRDIAKKLQDLVQPGSAWSDALGAVDIAKVQAQISTITNKANQLETTELETRIFRQSERGISSQADQARLSDLKTGGLDGANYNNFVVKYRNKYQEVSPNLFQLITSGDPKKAALENYQNRDVNGVPLPQTVDIRIDKPTGSGEDTLSRAPGAVSSGILDFFRNKPTTPNTSSYLRSNYQGGAPKIPPAISPPKISPALTPFNMADPEERRALIAAQSQTVAPIVPPPIRPPTTFGGK